jgi:hypothetical protein
MTHDGSEIIDEMCLIKAPKLAAVEDGENRYKDSIGGADSILAGVKQ